MFLTETRKNAIVDRKNAIFEYLYQIPVTLLNGDMQAASEIKMRHLSAADIS